MTVHDTVEKGAGFYVKNVPAAIDPGPTPQRHFVVNFPCDENKSPWAMQNQGYGQFFIFSIMYKDTLYFGGPVCGISGSYFIYK